jgi:hypothetical protein
MCNQIFVFSGTGNSLHVAKELQRRIPETEIVPIVAALRSKTIKTTGAIVGVVFPLHFFTLPYPVRVFFSRLQPQSAKYLFAVATRGGSESDAYRVIDLLLKSRGVSLGGFFYIDTINNMQIAHFETVTPEMCAEK